MFLSQIKRGRKIERKIVYFSKHLSQLSDSELRSRNSFSLSCIITDSFDNQMFLKNIALLLSRKRIKVSVVLVRIFHFYLVSILFSKMLFNCIEFQFKLN
jgi:hypothetical protein